MYPFVAFSFIILSLSSWLEEHLFTCPIKKYTGIDCLGCGFQRSFILLINGKFIESVQMYPATLPFIGLVLYTILHLKCDFKNGARNVKVLFILTVSIMLLFYFYKILTHQLF